MPWIPCPSFFGNSEAFVFQGHPTIRIYRPTRINDNFMYYNSGTKTLSNGIGFGGQMDYYGWFINDDFESGQSRAQPTSTTYGNPQLSKFTDFKIDSGIDSFISRVMVY